MGLKQWDEMTEEEREAYINQDYISMVEQLFDIRQMENIPDGYSYDIFSSLTSKQLKREIILLHLNGKSDVDIAWHLNCSKQYVGKVLKELGYKERIDDR